MLRWHAQDWPTCTVIPPLHSSLTSTRLGVRLNGPRPTWTRTDGGEGGSHPSNVHDHTYAIGGLRHNGTQRWFVILLF
jgi:hypothetical protein